MTSTAAIRETPDRTGAYPRRTGAHVELLAAQGERRRVAAGEVLLARTSTEERS